MQTDSTKQRSNYIWGGYIVHPDKTLPYISLLYQNTQNEMIKQELSRNKDHSQKKISERCLTYLRKIVLERMLFMNMCWDEEISKRAKREVNFK